MRHSWLRYNLRAEGDANDYLEKDYPAVNLSSIHPKRYLSRRNNIITGNVNLFGATSGKAFINGMAGERFAVRNSGAIAGGRGSW